MVMMSLCLIGLVHFLVEPFLAPLILMLLKQVITMSLYSLGPNCIISRWQSVRTLPIVSVQSQMYGRYVSLKQTFVRPASVRDIGYNATTQYYVEYASFFLLYYSYYFPSLPKAVMQTSMF